MRYLDGRRTMKTIILLTALATAAPALLFAQQSQHESPGQAYAFFGVGWGEMGIYNGPPIPPSFPPVAPTTSHPVILRFGGDGELFLHKGLGAGLDAGYARWGGLPYQKLWIGTGDLTYQFRRNASRGKVAPFVLAGVGGFFPAGEGRGAVVGDFGAGANVWFWRRTALRLGVRSYINPTNGFGYPGSYQVEFRVGFTFR